MFDSPFTLAPMLMQGPKPLTLEEVQATALSSFVLKRLYSEHSLGPRHMGCTGKNYFSTWDHLWDVKDLTRGLLWRRGPLCHQVRKGTGAEAPRHLLLRFQLALSPATPRARFAKYGI